MQVLTKAFPRAALIAAGLLIAAVGFDVSAQTGTKHLFNRHATDDAFAEQPGTNGGEGPLNGPAQEQYDNRAYPSTFIHSDQQKGASLSFSAIKSKQGGKKTKWQEVGPIEPLVSSEATYTGRPTYNSGRITSLALSPKCEAKSKEREDDDCKLFVGSAGGGVWVAENALSATPKWKSSSDGIPSNSTGSIIFDPTDKSGKTLYVGTGEENGSSDSEAGVGLYKSTDSGKSWKLVPGSASVATGRAIGAVAVDPADSKHIFIGTAVARHGSSSVNGGRFTPPDAPQVGLYESTDGGQTFTLAFSMPSDPVNPGSANGSDFFRGGVTNIQFYGRQVYFAMMDYGLYRAKGGGGFEQVFVSAGGGSLAGSIASRTEFSLAPLKNGKLRIYVGDSGTGPADFYRTDDASVAVPVWQTLSSSVEGTPGFGSYNFCSGQCSYDMAVYSPPGAPDIVYIGGQMQYDEIFTANPPSNGRAVQRSADAGANFTDMTNDTQNPPLGMHPDQHAIVATSDNPNIVFFGSDGGLVRIDGTFSNRSAECATRGLSPDELTDCQGWLAAIPTQTLSLNKGLATLQFQSLSINAQDPWNDIMGGTQDNGTWAYNGKGKGSWFESIGGDGGQSGIDVGNPNRRMHTYFGAQIDVNFHGTEPLGWNWVSDPLGTESASFYVPLINDPVVSGTWFVGQQRVWRTQDNGGPQAFLELYCNEYTGAYPPPSPQQCGDWEPLGASTLTGSAFGTDKSGSYVVATTRARGDTKTLWTGTRRGRMFVSKNADGASAAVTFTRIDDPPVANMPTPTRFISGIAVDPADANHAFVSYSGYDAYAIAAGTATGHVFEVRYNATTGKAVWTDLSLNIGDQPVTGIARDDKTGDLYVSTDFGVAMLPKGGATWVVAGNNLPPVAVYGLTIDSNAGVLYAATHGRGAWRLALGEDD